MNKIKNMKEEKERKQFNVQDFVSNEETPLNLAKLLKDVPPGTKLYLYSPLFGVCEFDGVRRGDRICVIDCYKYVHYFYEHGNFLKDEGECLLFPSRDNYDWRTFKVEKGFEVEDQQKKPNRTVKCSFCGREFIEPIPHRCNKNYRKRHLKWINLMEMEEERKQFNVKDFVSNKETPVETRNNRWVEIMDIVDEGEDSFPVKGRVDGVYPDKWRSEGKGILKGDDLFFKKSTMKTKQQFKLIPFDLSKAETPENPGGLEVVTRDNKCRIRILCTDRKDQTGRYPIIALYSYSDGGEEYYSKWQRSGKYVGVGDDGESWMDLFLKQPVKSRRMTNRELSWWLQEHLEEHRECMHKDDRWISSNFKYNSDNAEEEVPVSILIRSNGGEWKEPLFDEVEK